MGQPENSLRITKQFAVQCAGREDIQFLEFQCELDKTKSIIFSVGPIPAVANLSAILPEGSDLETTARIETNNFCKQEHCTVSHCFVRETKRRNNLL